MALWLKDTSTTPNEGWIYPSISGTDLKSPNYHGLFGNVKQHYESNGKTAPTKDEVDLWLCENVTIPCFDGQKPFRNRFTDPPSYAQRGMAGPNWPLLLQPLKLLAQPMDKGLGDIVARTIGPIGGDVYKSWYQRIFGKPCGCDERQETLNRDYPL